MPRRRPPYELDLQTVIIGLNSDRETRTWKFIDFKASTVAFNRASARDTLRFTTEAPKGFYIASIFSTPRGRC